MTVRGRLVESDQRLALREKNAASAGSIAGQQEPDRAGFADAMAQLAHQFKERFSQAETVRTQHANNTCWLDNEPPDAVIFAESTQEVAQIAKICHHHEVPIIAFGTGSSLEGHVNAPFGGVSVDLSRLNAIIDVRPDDQDCRVEAGVTRKQLNSHLRDCGLFFPIDPGADASIGGMAATRASGTNAVRYGTMKDAVLAARVVMANGEIIDVGGRARKSSAGYDLCRLMVGSEGTLGIMTELSLRLHPIPESIISGYCAFPNIENACNAVIATMQCAIPVARIELLDSLQIRACNHYSQLTLPERPTLFFELHGSTAGVGEQQELFGEVAKEYGGENFQASGIGEERNRLWQARHDVYWAGCQLRPEAQPLITDVCVPLSSLAECVTETAMDIERLNLIAPIVGHVGDGNFHVMVLVEKADSAEMRRAQDFAKALTARALSLGGTCTGEHGIGQGKREALRQEHGAAIGVMQAIKSALDPKNLLNPGKIL